MAGPVQSFIDSDLGVATSTTLHTVGALGFLGGTIAYLAWHRALRHGHDQAGLLRGAAFTTYLSIVVNLLGGFLRTYESDHPHLSQFWRSPWVQAIALKHLFLFAAMGAAIYLFEGAAPRLRRAAADGTLAQVPPRPQRVAASFVFAGIAVAALLGSVSQVVALLPEEPAPGPTAHEAASYENFTGTLAGTPVAPAHGGGAFVVPANATSLRFVVEAGGAPGVRITLSGPDGTAQGVADPSTTILDHPKPGAWRFDLDAPVGTGTAWSASVKLTTAAR